MKFLTRIPILKRLIPSIIKRYAFYFSDFKREIVFEKVIFDLDIRHLIDRQFYIFREYEEKNFKKLIKVISDENAQYFIDVGSCWGIYSLRLAKRFDKLKIKAFEPIISNVKRLKNSINKNKISNIEIFHTALGDTTGTIQLGSNNDWSPNYKINEENIAIIENSTVKILDELLNLDGETIVMKIDVEGFEYEVLNGAKHTLLNNNCFLQIEIRYENFKKIDKFLKELGYRNEDNLRPLKENDYADCFFRNF